MYCQWSVGLSHRILGHLIQRTTVTPFVLQIAQEVYIHSYPIKETLEEYIPGQWDLLCHTPIVLVARTGSGKLITWV